MTSMLRCHHCGRHFSAAAPGTRNRNHCPHCLWSVHLDNIPGDRSAHCGGEMEPLAIACKGDGEWMLLHRCKKCGTIHANRIAGDDDAVMLIKLAGKPLANPPFPILPGMEYPQELQPFP